MTITLAPDQQAWLETQVKAGNIDSVAGAVRAAVAEMMTAEQDDLSWAKAEVDKARLAYNRGDIIGGQPFLSRLDQFIASLETS